MNKTKILILIGLSWLLFSCNQNEGTENQENEIIRSSFQVSPLESVYSNLRPSIQTFEISNEKPVTLVALNGTKIFIPNNCFVNSKGNDVKGNITIELIEAFKLSDFITSGLVTLSDNVLIQSNGMLFIDAKSSGNSLTIKQGVEISISMPTMGKKDGFQMFTGNGSNWTVDSSMLEDDYMIPLPLDLLYPKGYQELVHCSSYIGGEQIEESYYDSTNIPFMESKYENTIIATREFKERLSVLTSMMSHMSYYTKKEYYFDIVDCHERKFNYEIWKTYFDAPAQPLSYLDSLTKDSYKGYYNNHKNDLLEYLDDINIHKREHFSNWTDTNYFFDFRKVSFEDQFMSPLEYFPNCSRSELKTPKEYGFDLNSSDAFDNLLKHGLSNKEINEVLTYNFKRESIIEQLRKEKAQILDKEKLSKLYETSVFSTKTLGWINCDRFYDDPNSGKADILMADISNNKLNFIDFSLVIPYMNVRLNGFKLKDNLYSFTQEKGPYSKLPIGYSAIVVGISVENDSTFFASKKITIEDGLNLDFKLEYIIEDALRDSLESVLDQPL
jgi:hypothetical protein